MTVIYNMTIEDKEEDANIGKDLTLDFLVKNNFITKEVGEELSKTLFLTVRKKSWFTKLFKKGDENPVWRIAKLAEVPEEVE